MNRDVLNGLFVSNGGMYANDALQSICSKLAKYSQVEVMRHIANYPPGGFDSHEEEKDYQIAMQSQRNMISMFDCVVALGKEPALEFIKNNYTWATGHEYKEGKYGK